MLNAKAFHECLQRSLGDGVETVMVIGISGDILGLATSAADGDKSYMEKGLLSSVATNLWSAYAGNDLAQPQQQAMNNTQEDPESLEAVFTCVGGHNLCVVGVGGVALLCLTATKAACEVGMLKTKAAALQRHLDGPLRSVLCTAPQE